MLTYIYIYIYIYISVCVWVYGYDVRISVVYTLFRYRCIHELMNSRANLSTVSLKYQGCLDTSLSS